MRPYGPTALRLCLAAVFFAHGAQKLFGIWGGPGLAATAKMLETWGVHQYAMPLATTLAVAEVLGALLLVIGAGTLWVTLILLADVGIGVWKVHYQNGFFINWDNTPGHGHGVEFSLIMIGALFCLMLTGPGAFSIDERRSQNAEAMRAGRARARKV